MPTSSTQYHTAARAASQHHNTWRCASAHHQLTTTFSSTDLHTRATTSHLQYMPCDSPASQDCIVRITHVHRIPHQRAIDAPTQHIGNTMTHVQTLKSMSSEHYQPSATTPININHNTPLCRPNAQRSLKTAKKQWIQLIVFS